MLWQTQTCCAVTIRHDLSDSQYTALANSDHPYGGLVLGNGFIGSGTLISPNWVLTAAHVLSGSVSFQTSAGTIGIVEHVSHPSWGDIALGRLASPIRSIEPVKLYDLEFGVEDGQDAIILGAGNTGTGLSGQRGGTGGTRRAAQTYIHANADAWGWGGNRLLTWFRSPTGGADPLEGGSAQGDSGGSVLLNVDGEYAIAGVQQLAWWGGSGGDAIGKYNTGGVYVRSAPVNDWILQHATDAIVVSSAPPPPLPTDFQWATSSGNWQSSSNWSPSGLPNGNDVQVTFGSGINSTKSVSLRSSVTVKTMRFDHNFRYHLTGGSVTFAADQGSPLLNVANGDHSIASTLSLAQNTTSSIGPGDELELQGRLNLNGRTLSKTGSGTLILNGSAASNSGTLSASGGWIKGNGTLGGRLFNTNATVAPGDGTGVLTVNGDFVQTSSGILQMEIGGTSAGNEYDLLVADGFQAGGTLEVLLRNNFSPVGGDLFDLFEFTSISGNFSSLQLPTGIDWDTSKLLIDGTLLVTPTIFEWNGISNGRWSNSGNWNSVGVPDGNSVTVSFGTDATSVQVVFVDQSVSVRELQIDNTNVHVLTGETLILAADTGSALIDVAQGAHYFALPVRLEADTDVQVAANASLSLGGALNLNGQVLTKTGSGTLVLNVLPGTFAGSLNVLEGTVTGDGVLLGDLHNASATVDPGDQSRRLVIAGNYSQDVAGLLRMELASPQDYDQLYANSANLAGALQLTLAGGYVPVVGEVFDILNLGSSTGNFETWDFPARVNWDVSNLLEDGTISVVPSLFTWTTEGSGNWSDSANWLGGDVPVGVAPDVLFNNATIEPTVIVADRDVMAKSLVFNSPDQPYFIVGGDVHLQAAGGNAAILSFGTAHHIASSVTLHSDTDVTVAAGGALTLSNELDLNGFGLTTRGVGTLFLNTRTAPTVAGTIRVTSGSTLGGHGTLVGDLWNFSAVAPGTDGVGTFVISGEYIQSHLGQLQMEISDKGHDQLVATKGTLNGVFELSVLEGFIPQPNTTFRLISFGSLSGQFNALNLQGLPGGLSWVTTDLETQGEVSVIGLLGDFDFNDVLELSDINELVAAVAAGSTDLVYDLTGDSIIDGDDLNSWIVDIFDSLPGDANLDHAVDAQDFAFWESHRFTASNQWGHGDFDANGNIDVRDFNIWNRHKSMAAGISGHSVPEPSGTATVLLAGCFACSVVLRRRCQGLGS